MRFLKKYLPNADAIRHEHQSGWVKRYLNRHPQLWYFNRYSVARGFSVGLFAATIPLPLQMIIAITLAVIFRGNVPVAVAATWITNPVTMVPFIYGIYKVGEWLLGEGKNNATDFKEFHWSIDNIHITPHWKFDNIYITWMQFQHWIGSLSKSFFVGLPVVAFGMAVFGYFFVMVAWRISVSIQLLYRARKRKK